MHLYFQLLSCLTLVHLTSSYILPSIQRLAKSPKMSLSNLVETHPTKVNVNDIQWFNSLKSVPGAEILDIREWRDENWRTTEGGFAGRDFIHSKTASVRILDYLKIPAKEADPSGLTEYNFPRLVGPAHFTPRCESHRGLCHGGSFCALMDDAIGWMGFCVSGEVKPWSGYTVQVNTALKKPVPVDSVLRMEAWVTRREGARKYWIGARLSDPSDETCIYCEGEGLFLLSPDAM